MVIWLVGLSGAGKTTIGRALTTLWRHKEPQTVLIDGDDIRKYFPERRDYEPYSLADRRANAERIASMSLWLDQQSLNVVVSILCIFPDILQENRVRFSNYFEVFVDAPFDQIKKRDPKGLYVGSVEGIIDNVVGVDIPFPVPTNPDIVINNSDQHHNANKHASRILEQIQ